MCGKPKYDDREKLYNEFWEKPVTEGAEQYGVSDVAKATSVPKNANPSPCP